MRMARDTSPLLGGSRVLLVLIDGAGCCPQRYERQRCTGKVPKYGRRTVQGTPLATGAAISARADFSHKDDAYQDIPNLDAAKMIEYDVINLRAAYLSEDAKWEVAAWVKNAADEEYLLHNSVLNPGLAQLPLPAAPRTVGLTATWNFGE